MKYEHLTGRLKSASGGIRLLLLVCLLIPVIMGCGVKLGVYHRVREGETLWRISRRYNIPLQDIAEINNIQNSRSLNTGDRIFIPGAYEVLRVRPVPPRKKGRRKKTDRRKRRVVLKKGMFVWPLKGKVVSGFGIRGGKKHNGIEIAGKKGEKVSAAADGQVMYSGDELKGYGKTVIISHKGGYYTVYAHNSKNMVVEGDRVRKGTLIALLGNSGNIKDYRLYFEIRRGKKARNPLFFLP